MKLNIGCGNIPYPGYINCDLHNTSHADVVCDARALPFDAWSVTEAVLSHTLEHFKTHEVPHILSECWRVLGHGGLLKIEVPDFVANLEEWLAADEDGRWGHLIERIYGQHQHEGDTHKTGFTKERLIKLLGGAGFVPLSVERLTVKHHGPVIQAEALKE